MSAPYCVPDIKAENAVKAVIIAAGTGIPDSQIMTSFEADGTTVLPHSVVINFLGSIEDGHNSGNERMNVSIKVKSSLDRSAEDSPDPRAIHEVFAARVWDALRSSTLYSELSAAVSDFTVFDSVERRRGRSRVENRKAISEMLLEFTAAPSDIA